MPPTSSGSCTSARSTATASGCSRRTCRGSRPTPRSTRTSSTNLLYREGNRLKLKQFGRAQGCSRASPVSSAASTSSRTSYWPSTPVSRTTTSTTRWSAYYAMLDSYRFMSFGTQIVEAVRGAREPDVHASGDGRPEAPDRRRVPGRQPGPGAAHRAAGQAATGRPTWWWWAMTTRRSTSGAAPMWRNIVTFAARYPNVTKFELLANRRSRPAIVEWPMAFAQTIPGRLTKQMTAVRPRRRALRCRSRSGTSIEQDRGRRDRAGHRGAPRRPASRYRDIAILVRGRARIREDPRRP